MFKALKLMTVALLLIPYAAEAAESLSVSFKLRSMYYDPKDKDAFKSKFEGTATNGIPDKERWLYVKRNDKDYYKGFYGYLDPKDQPHGAVSAVVWLENAKDGSFVKTLGRWCGNNGYKGKQPGYAVKADEWLFVQGDVPGRIYDLFRFNGAYGRKPGGKFPTLHNCPNVKDIGFTSGQLSANPHDGSTGDYDSVLGPTIGCKVNGKIYLDLDNPMTPEDDASLITTAPKIPNRADDKQPQPWNMKLAWNPKTKKTEECHLPHGEYNLIIEAVEWAMEREYYSSLAKKGGISTPTSQKFFQQFDHIKTIRYKYDGKSWKIQRKSNLDDVYATDTMAKAQKKKKVKGYLNYWTGNKLVRGKNEPAVIYDIKVNYTSP